VGAEARSMGVIGTQETTGLGCAFDNVARYNFASGYVQVETDGGGAVEPHLGGARGWGRCPRERIGWEQHGAGRRASDLGWDAAGNQTLWQWVWAYPSLRDHVPLGSGRRENGSQESPTVDSRPRPQQQKWRTKGLAGGGGDTVAEH